MARQQSGSGRGRRGPDRHTHGRHDSADWPLRNAVAEIVSGIGPAVPVTLDIAAAQRVSAAAAGLAGALAALVETACASAAMPAGPSDAPQVAEVVVTSVDSGTALEIEVADSGPMTAPGRMAALTAARAFATRHGGHVAVRPCPEGGTAVTIHLPHRQASRRAA